MGAFSHEVKVRGEVEQQLEFCAFSPDLYWLAREMCWNWNAGGEGVVGFFVVVVVVVVVF